MKYYIPLFILALLSSRVFAKGTFDFLNCKTKTPVLGRCSVPPLELAESQEFESEFQISFRLPCRGHTVGFAFATDSETTTFTASEKLRTLNLTGNGPLLFKDVDPNATFNASFSPGCHLQLESITILPSAGTLERWHAQVNVTVQALAYGAQLYLLSSDFGYYQEWDVRKTATLLAAVEEKILLYESRCIEGNTSQCVTLAHLRLIAAQLQIKLSHASVPLLVPGSDAGQTLAEIYYLELQIKVSAAELLAEKLAIYGYIADEALYTALAQAKALEQTL